MEKLSRTQVEQALDKVREWFPEEAENISRNKELIIDHIVNDKPPKSDSPLRLIEPAIHAERERLEIASLTACEEACGMVAFDVVMFVFGLIGLHVSNQERLARALLRELGPDTLRGLSRAIHNFSVADSATAKAKALFAIMGGIWNAGGFKAALKVAKDEMSWWDWMKTGVIAVAQLTAWFATDGIAFVAEAALSVMSAEQLIEDSVKADNACRTS